MIYLDNAATTNPKPAAVQQAVHHALAALSANPGRSGHRLSVASAEAVFRAREAAAEFFGLEDPSHVIFTAGCTAAINQVLKGVLQPGDRVVISNLEHNAVMRPLASMGVEYESFAVEADDAQTLENLKKAVQSDTKMVFVTGASNVTGKRLPIRKIGAFCRENGLLFGVDAAQTAGVTDIDMARDGIDFLCVAGHKGLYAPMGIGILLTRLSLRPILQGGTGTESKDFKQPETLPEALESGTPNLPGIAGLLAGIGFVRTRGVAAIAAHEMALTRRLYAGLRELPHIALYTPPPTAETAVGVLSFNVRGIPSDAVADYLDKNGVAVRAGLHCAPTAHRAIGTLPYGTVRVAFSAFSEAAQADFLLLLLKRAKNIEIL